MGWEAMLLGLAFRYLAPSAMRFAAASLDALTRRIEGHGYNPDMVLTTTLTLIEEAQLAFPGVGKSEARRDYVRRHMHSVFSRLSESDRNLAIELALMKVKGEK